MYFNRVYPKMFIGSGAIKESGHPHDLKAGQIGLVDYKTNALIATASATKAAHPMAYLAIGSYAKKDGLGNTNTNTGSTAFNGGRTESDKSKGINPSYISKWFKTVPTTGKQHKIQVGYDGSNDCTCPAIFEKETTYNLLVEAKGAPVLKALHRNLYKTYSVFTGCSTPCSDTCVETAEPRLVFESWAKQINSDHLMSAFVLAKVGKKTNALPGDAVAYNVYTITLTDAGTIQDLAKLQVAYPALDVTLKSHTDITSVYQVIKTGNAPANYSSVAWVDAGYDVYKVTRKMCMTLPLTVAANDTVTTAALAGRTDIVANSVVAYVDPAANTNAGVYSSTVQVTQLSNNYVQLINDTIGDAYFDLLPSVKGEAFKTCPCDLEGSGAGCYFLTIESIYSDDVFGDSSWDQFEAYDPTPVLLNAQLVDEHAGICNVKGLAVTTLQQALIPTGTGEELIRDYIVYRAYKQDIFDANPRMRQVFDDTIMSVVKRSKQYVKYHLVHHVPRFNNPSGLFDNDQYMITIAFEQGVDTSAFEALLDSYVTSAGTQVTLEVK